MSILTKDNLLDRIKIDKKTNCWIYAMYKDKRGYGRTSYKGKVWLLHRLSYYFYKGRIPKGLYVCHRCDNPSCINPKHLFLGDQYKNMRDMINKGRGNIGEKSPNAKLTEKQVIKIKIQLSNGLSLRHLAKKYSISPTQIHSIKTGRKWGHI